MPNATYVPSRIGEGHFTDFQPPAAGATDNGNTGGDAGLGTVADVG